MPSSAPVLVFACLLATALAGPYDMATFQKSEAYGKPCLLEKGATGSDWDESYVCPAMFFCFVDKVPFHVVDGTIDRDYTSTELDALLATAPETNDKVPEIGPEMDDGEKSRFGYCDCNKFYGLEDPTGEDGGFCESLNAGGTLFMVWSYCLVAYMFWCFLAYLYTIYGFHKSKQLKNNASCQTLFHGLWFCLCFIGTELGYGFTLSMLDTGMVFHGSLLGYMFSLSIFGFGVVALNIAVAWIEVVEKSQKKGQAGNTKKYKMGIYGSILTYFLLMFVCFIVLGSTTLAGVVVMLALIFKAVVFTFAGKKLGKMLEGGGPKAGEEDAKEMNMEMMVKGTSKRIAFVSAGTLVLVVLFLMTTNNNVWLSTVSLQGSMTIVCYINSTILCFIRFGGRRAMIKAGLKPIFKVEGAQQGKLDVKNTTTSTSSSVAPEP
ncbi:hypothetical protein TeGR_g10229 [Tetraparma gracilis]|uniref:Uncharacterized protein n=1 Tax=Tetraparma gracilis TaxID=2962635 RepID=A0ABQ6MHB3_9STRA|nr:hypothetical protein TeGR_g10229 [Tetraparma gracilis]